MFHLRCCGAKWKRMSLRERQPYMEESERLKQLHARQYPTYKVLDLKKKNENLSGCLFSINHESEAKQVNHQIHPFHHQLLLHHHLHQFHRQFLHNLPLLQKINQKPLHHLCHNQHHQDQIQMIQYHF
jgi:hypothetical protein